MIFGPQSWDELGPLYKNFLFRIYWFKKIRGWIIFWDIGRNNFKKRKPLIVPPPISLPQPPPSEIHSLAILFDQHHNQTPPLPLHFSQQTTQNIKGPPKPTRTPSHFHQLKQPQCCFNSDSNQQPAPYLFLAFSRCKTTLIHLEQPPFPPSKQFETTIHSFFSFPNRKKTPDSHQKSHHHKPPIFG